MPASLKRASEMRGHYGDSASSIASDPTLPVTLTSAQTSRQATLCPAAVRLAGSTPTPARPVFCICGGDAFDSVFQGIVECSPGRVFVFRKLASSFDHQFSMGE